jgi:hypothetical protein
MYGKPLSLSGLGSLGHGAIDFLQGDLPLGTVDHVRGDAGLLAAILVGSPLLGQKQLGVEKSLVASLTDAEVDGDDAVGDLADTTEVLTLHTRGLGTRLEGGGLIDEANRAKVIGGQGGQDIGDMTLQLFADLGEIPKVVLEKLLQGADGTARGQGDGFAGLALEFGEESFAVGMQVSKGLSVAATEEIRLQEAIQRWPQSLQLLLGHGCGLLAGLLLF